jgi:hypothetical protein
MNLSDVKKSSSIGVKHEYTDLEVNEISIVDLPANQEEFAVIKRVENNSELEKKIMAEKKQEIEEVKKEEESEFDSGNISDIIKKIGDIESKIEAIKLEEQVVKKEDEKSQANDEVVKMVVEKLKEQNVKKDEQSLIDELTTELTKAKTFTPSRIKKLEEASELLTKLMDEIKQIGVGQSPKNNLPANSQFGDSGIKQIMKSVEDIGQNFSKLAETVNVLKNKVEQFEKIGQPSKTLDKSEQKEVKKSDNLWGGIFNQSL